MSMSRDLYSIQSHLLLISFNLVILFIILLNSVPILFIFKLTKFIFYINIILKTLFLLKFTFILIYSFIIFIPNIIILLEENYYIYF